jgi:nucleotide-binding universal stress UspA family protein
VKVTKGVSKMFNKILIASDGSGPSMRAARAGALIAKALSAEVTVLTVASIPEQYRDDLNAELEEGFVQEWKESLDATVDEVKREGIEPATRFIREGNAVEAVLGELESAAYDLLVIGRTGAGNPASKSMGSVSDTITSRATCSLMVVR